MNIGIDIDDTITNTYETLIPMVAINYGLNIEEFLAKLPSYKMITGSFPNYEDFQHKYYDTVAKLVPIRPRAVEVINKLREEGHRIVFISARHYGEYTDPYKLSYDYLTEKGFKFDKLIVNTPNKAKECVLENIDLFIDDNTLNCKAVKNRGIATLQMDTIFTKGSKQIRHVGDWDEVYKIVHEMYAS